MTLLDELHARRQDIMALARRHGINEVRIFGSVARREERAESDIDFLVGTEQGRSYFDLIYFQQAMEHMLHRNCDVVSKEGLHWVVKDAILQEATLL